MQADGKKKLSGRVLFSSYFLGVTLCLVTQLVVMLEHGPKVYVSLLWAVLYPVQLFITDTFTRMCYALHLSPKTTTAIGIGVAVTSVLFGLLVPAMVGLARSGNRLVRYVGFAALGIFVLLALLWSTLPNVF